MISCPVRDDFMAEVSLPKDETRDAENSEGASTGLLLQLKFIRLKCGNDETSEERTDIFWPEKTIPNQIRYLDKENCLEIKGTNNVARVTLRLKDSVVETIGDHGRRAEPLVVKGWHNSEKQVESHRESNALTNIILQTLDLIENDSSAELTEMLEQLYNKVNRIKLKSEQRQILLSCREEKQLFNFVWQKGSHFGLLQALVRRDVFGSMSAFAIVSALFERKDISLLEHFVKSCADFPEDAYVSVLKICSSLAPKESCELLDAILTKSFTRDVIVLHLERQLSVQDAVTLLRRLMPRIVLTGVRDIRAAVQIVNLIFDAHLTGILMEEKHYDVVFELAYMATSFIQALELYELLQSQIDALKTVGSVSQNSLSDYSIKSILLKNCNLQKHKNK